MPKFVFAYHGGSPPASPEDVERVMAEWSDWMIIMIPSLDRPNDIRPLRHYGVESRLAWFDTDDDYPRERYEDDFIAILSDPARAERAELLARYGSE